MTAIINAKLILEKEIVEDKILLFDNSIIKIIESIHLANFDVLHSIDAKGNYVSAGFIDLHIHGLGGADVMDATPDALEIISSGLLQTGTTSFLATTMTMPSQDIDSALYNIKSYASKVRGAQILGVHIEGPFINTLKHGAQDKVHIQAPNFKLIENYMQEIKMITLAPEVEGAKEFIKMLRKEYPHILLSIGHSDASYEESKKSFSWGISHATHLFNAMNPYHHRKPGIVGAVFDSDVSCDIIADLVHTHPFTLELIYKMKKNKVLLITDSMRAGCMKCGTYDLGGRTVEVADGKAVLADGTLAGSVLMMNKALSNMMRHTSINLIDVVNCVTKIPAEKLSIKKGKLQEGYDADIVIFDKNFSIISTIVNGKVKYTRN